MLKAVLFDLDGTLLNRDASLKKFVDDQYDRFDALKAVSKEHYCTRFIELDNHGYVWKDRVYQQLLSELPPSTLTWEILLADYLADFPRHCTSFPHIEEVLQQLKQQHIALGIITNGYHDFQLANIQALGIAQYFDVILVSESQGIKKPNPGILKVDTQQIAIEADAVLTDYLALPAIVKALFG